MNSARIEAGAITSHAAPRPAVGRYKETFILSMYDAMTVEEKVGQMLMVGVPGVHAQVEAKRLIDEHRVGGVILFAENVLAPEQVAQLNRELQQMAEEAGAPDPLFISIDQEGGPVARIRDGFTPLPSAMAIGATGSAAYAEAVGALNGAELAAVGVNMNLAPVLDVNNNPHNPVIGLRSFSEDPEVVAEFGIAYMRGLQKQGLLATAKHFPGHGDTNVDSHFALPSISHGRDRLDEVELVPFRAAIEAGIDAILSAHVTFPQIDKTPGVPSTLSRRILTDMLRDELGFEGLIITDALEMKGITSQHRIADAAVMAVEAGADIVLIAQSYYNDDAVEAIAAIVNAVNEGRIAMERIDASLRRIKAAKSRIADASARWVKATADGSALTKLLNETIRQPASLQLADDVARHAVTVVRNGADLLPLGETSVDGMLIVGPEVVTDTFVQQIGRSVQPNLDNVETVNVSARPTEAEIGTAVSKARAADTVLVVTTAAMNRPEQARLVQALHDAGLKLVVVAAGGPYDLAAFPDVETYVAAYGTQPLHIRAAVDVLLGQAEAKGRLPVTIPDLYPNGHGLNL